MLVSLAAAAVDRKAPALRESLYSVETVQCTLITNQAANCAKGHHVPRLNASQSLFLNSCTNIGGLHITGLLLADLRHLTFNV